MITNQRIIVICWYHISESHHTEVKESSGPKKGVKGVKNSGWQNPDTSATVVHDVNYKINSTLDTSEDMPQILRPRRPAAEPNPVLLSANIKLAKLQRPASSSTTKTQVTPPVQKPLAPSPVPAHTKVDIPKPKAMDVEAKNIPDANDEGVDTDQPIDLSISRENNTSTAGIFYLHILHHRFN